MTHDELLRHQLKLAHNMNEVKGNLTQCSICNGRGYFTHVNTETTYFYASECECMKRRKAQLKEENKRKNKHDN